MIDPSALLFLENQLCFPLYATSRLTTKRYAPYLKKLDITYPQYLVFLVLWKHKNQSVREIGQRLYLDSNTLTPMLKRLEQKELIQRNRSKEDERTVIISLTKKGELLKEKAMEIPQNILESFKESAITETEINELKKTLTRLLVLLDTKTKQAC
jgi:DNA-binding MarR family transcriptional regulator